MIEILLEEHKDITKCRFRQGLTVLSSWEKINGYCNAESACGFGFFPMVKILVLLSKILLQGKS